MPLPQPNGLTSLVVRTDFSDDTAWDALCAVLGTAATCVNDPGYDGVEIGELLGEDLHHVFLADARAQREHLLLALDLADLVGAVLRVPVDRFAEVSAHLSSGAVDLEDYLCAGFSPPSGRPSGTSPGGGSAGPRRGRGILGRRGPR
ncbi:hypothetical protein IAG44_24630 [Streptomyces roseirectus]|uniref:DUF6924 domain-containing protein n=1 Tax=Streptomyces roseirectus TaxID=2768066 RepID=A0A7H0IHM2_9ACTN|nr:hypothetical protein [Streptomyces roseirectus]QNP72288.1 hypothetical protein IAG44_24630 [Streptomyces roseirectus]